MHLTDYRELTIKDVITQIEPELFKKVTGLSVKDFDVLCLIGLFDPEKMNQGIFGFRKYENSSLSYTGIDMHEGESIGGWDTVLHREEYELLYSKQQATVADLTQAISLDEKKETANEDYLERRTLQTEKNTDVTSMNEQQKDSSKKKWEKIISSVKVGIKNKHKKFGYGIVVWMDDMKNHIKIKFDDGEKQFQFPVAFINVFF